MLNMKTILNYTTYNFFYVLSYLEYLKRKQLFQSLSNLRATLGSLRPTFGCFVKQLLLNLLAQSIQGYCGRGRGHQSFAHHSGGAIKFVAAFKGGHTKIERGAV